MSLLNRPEWIVKSNHPKFIEFFKGPQCQSLRSEFLKYANGNPTKANEAMLQFSYGRLPPTHPLAPQMASQQVPVPPELTQLIPNPSLQLRIDPNSPTGVMLAIETGNPNNLYVKHEAQEDLNQQLVAAQPTPHPGNTVTIAEKVALVTAAASTIYAAANEVFNVSGEVLDAAKTTLRNKGYSPKDSEYYTLLANELSLKPRPGANSTDKKDNEGIAASDIPSTPRNSRNA